MALESQAEPTGVPVKTSWAPDDLEQVSEPSEPGEPSFVKTMKTK